MILINVLEDEELQKVVKMFISGMLPHENFEKENFVQLLQHVLSYIKLEEFSMEYYVILSALTEINKINASVGSTPVLTREIFSDIVEVSVEELLYNKCVRIEDYLNKEGLNTNFAIQTAKEEAMQRLYSRSMTLYDECFALAIPSSSADTYLPAYKAAFIARTMLDVSNVQATIIVKGCWIGKRFYSGYADALEYMTHLTAMVNGRIAEVENTTSLVSIDSVEKVNALSESLKQAFIPIAYWGIPPLDGDGITQGTPILRHRMIVVVGSVNVGKSMFCKEAAISVALAGGKALYMYGEGTKEDVWAGLLINYIYRKYQKFVTTQMLIDEDSQPDEIRKIIRMAKLELMESKAISFREAYNYDTFYDEAMNDYKQLQYDLLIIDHSLALKSKGKLAKENVDNLAIQARNLKREIPAAVLIASHPSVAAKEAMSRDARIPGEITVTRESSTLEAEADDLYILRSNETLVKQGLIALEDKKRRNADHLRENIILNKMFDVCHFEYDPARQTTDQLDKLDAEQALFELDQAYGDSSDDYYTL